MVCVCVCVCVCVGMVMNLIEARDEARRGRDFSTADDIREVLQQDWGVAVSV